MQPFTVVIPYYNRAKWLPRTLRSLREQSYRPIELILVDNNSTDSSAALCRAFRDEASEPGFTVRLLREQRPGASAARNAGLAAATSPFITFFDSDDEMSPSFLGDMARLLQDADMSAAATRMVFGNGQEKVRQVYPTADPSDQILTGMLATQGMAFRTPFLRRIGGWDESVLKWNDWELGIRALLARPKLQWATGAYHRVYQHEESLTGSSFSATLAGIRTALAAVDALLQTAAPTDRRLHAAMAVRRAFLAGRLRREGNKSAALAIFNEMQEATAGRRAHIALYLLYAYVARGGKGAWWIARHTLRAYR